MRRGLLWCGILAIALVGHAAAQEVHCTAKGKATQKVAGPHGLEGWTIDDALPDSSYGDECFSGVLVIARNGHVIRRRKAGPILWHWIFWDDGKQLAIEEGPLHFGMACVLEDLKSGRPVATHDCYHMLPKDVPEWVKALEPM
ncbi:MAG TPA: hypothetical protein VMV57_08860 [Terracidiphilus sp.]|nr:hypothetical protein [Terracidiphilus sp.]